MKYTKFIASGVLALASLTACDKDLLSEEQYKKVVYVLSHDNNNVFPMLHAFEEPESTGYLTVYVSGTLPIDEPVTVEFEYNDTLLSEYNRLNFDIDTAKFARRLKPENYTLESMSVTMNPGDEDSYALLPVKIRPEGLSPDSTYMLPLQIKSISNYELNPKKSTVLYRVYVENKYAEQIKSTMYFMKGTRLKDGDKIEAAIASNKRLKPISATRVRLFPEAITYKEELDYIKRWAIYLDINDNGTVDVSSVDKVEVEQLPGCKYDAGKEWITINYRYKNSENRWCTINEVLKRVK